MGGITGGTSSDPLSTLTGALSSVTAPLQTGIDALQGLESLKTDIITSTIDTLESSGIHILPQAADQISALADLGTLTFETSEATVNGVLDAVSGALDLNPTAVSDALTGVAATLIDSGTSATEILSDLTGGLDSNPLESVTDLLGGLAGGTSGNPLEAVTDLLGGLAGAGSVGSFDTLTDVLGSVSDAVHGLIDVGETLVVSTAEVTADTAHALVDIVDVAADSTLDVVETLLNSLESISTSATGSSASLGGLTDLLGGVTSSLGSVTSTSQGLGSVTNLLDQLFDQNLSVV